jgi:hypothetical protein
MTIVEQFSDDFQNDFFYKITGRANALRLMSGSAHMIRFKADPGNIGTFFIGNDALRGDSGMQHHVLQISTTT